MSFSATRGGFAGSGISFGVASQTIANAPFPILFSGEYSSRHAFVGLASVRESVAPFAHDGRSASTGATHAAAAADATDDQVRAARI